MYLVIDYYREVTFQPSKLFGFLQYKCSFLKMNNCIDNIDEGNSTLFLKRINKIDRAYLI